MFSAVQRVVCNGLNRFHKHSLQLWGDILREFGLGSARVNTDFRFVPQGNDPNEAAFPTTRIILMRYSAVLKRGTARTSFDWY